SQSSAPQLPRSVGDKAPEAKLGEATPPPSQPVAPAPSLTPPPPAPHVAQPAFTPAAPNAQPGSAEPAGNRVEAHAGVGKKGHYGGKSYVEAVVSARFSLEERIIFDAQIPKQMQIYKELNNRAPKSHEEFMKEIIEA